MSSINLVSIERQLANVATFTACRLPRHGRHGSRVTIFPSRKNNAPLMCESLLEAAFSLELERRTDVLCYQIHPYTLKFVATKVRYTPDFQVTFTSGSQQLIEVKNDKSFECKRIRARLSRIIDLLAEHDCVLECLPMCNFYNATRTSNLEYLYHLAYSNDGGAGRAIRHLIAQQPQAIPLRQLLQNKFTPAEIAHALFYQVIQCNISKPITLESMVWLN
ncbi:hypothetical protein KC131_25590 [Pseudomonas sp. JQ170]|uniref:hypothetical protein n=1 Tax=unclassified Pseudomonas TaxID=196821 RepID=UPI00264EAD92|nr:MULTISPECIES: hypothetical protein [unclassified Pseudomonas]MDN7144022.1 hypothetical protein [Pseudomonas sp. JQ170]WRO74990.1 hypothetical protein U9R80_21175 [Pseudomonas sp. 170C]